MHLAANFPAQQDQRIAEIISDKLIYRQYGLQKEYHELVVAAFPTLDQKSKEAYLGFVDEEPNIQEKQVQYEKVFGKRPSESDIIDKWEKEQLVRLAGLRDYLQTEWQERYDRLSSKHGKQPPPSYPRPSGAEWIPDQSPRTADQLLEMSIEELREYLCDWQPPANSFHGPSKRGLATELERAAERNPVQFSSEAES